MFTKDDYANLFKSLLPPGKLFKVEKGSNIDDLAKAIGQVFSDFSASCDDFLQQIFPDRADSLLTEWETEYGLPDECSQTEDTIEVRRKLLIAKYNSLGGQTPAYYISLAAYLGYQISITEFNAFRTNVNTTNSPLYGEDWMWVWQVNCQELTGTFFRTNLSTTNEPLIYYDNYRLICFLEKYKPAHTKLIFNFV